MLFSFDQHYYIEVTQYLMFDHYLCCIN